MHEDEDRSTSLFHEPSSPSAALDALLDDPAAAVAVKRLSSVALHRLICGVGMADSEELIALASPAQVREVLDLELWDGDRLQGADALDWMIFLISALEDEQRLETFRALDIELIGIVLKRYLRIYLAEEEDDLPEEMEGTEHRTPDGWFVLDVLAYDQHTVEQVIVLVDTLFMDDAIHARRLLQNLMWELPTELEEMSYRWRTNRLMDMGFADPQDALSIYSYLSPSSVSRLERTADRPLVESSDSVAQVSELTHIAPPIGSFWERALATIDDRAEQDRLSTAMIILCNRSLSADRAHPADLEAVSDSLQRLRWRLSLGLEYLCGGEVSRASEVLRGVALLRIARVGFSLTLDLRRKVMPAVRSRALGKRPGAVDLLDPPLCDQVRALIAPHPRFHDQEAGDSRAFETLEDLATADGWVDEALDLVTVFEAVERPTPFPDDLTMGDLYRTMVVNTMVGHEGAIDRSTLVRFIHRFVRDGALLPDVSERAGGAIPEALREKVPWRRWMETLEESIGQLRPEDLDLRFIDGLWLAVTDEHEHEHCDHDH